jgi:hypothetical protein
MVKSIFVCPTELSGIEYSGSNHLIIVAEGLDKKIWQRLKKSKMDLSISVNAFGPDGCPADAATKEKLFKKIKAALGFKPKQIWIDHFRFDGHWEAIKNRIIPDIHQDCIWCTDKNRVLLLENIAREIMAFVNKRCQIGYFAVPFKSNELQDHSAIGRIFDLSSPMLYHRMINKKPVYISEYVKWLSEMTKKPVLPIIQIKTMPDNLKDILTRKEIKAAFREAVKKPSIGVSFFCWTHALEKNKTEIIKELLSSAK